MYSTCTVPVVLDEALQTMLDFIQVNVLLGYMFKYNHVMHTNNHMHVSYHICSHS